METSVHLNERKIELAMKLAFLVIFIQWECQERSGVIHTLKSLILSEVDNSLPSMKEGSLGLFESRWRIKVFGIEMSSCHWLSHAIGMSI